MMDRAPMQVPDRFFRRYSRFSSPVVPDRLAPYVSALGRMDQEVVALGAHDDHGRLAILGDGLHPPLSNPLQV